MNSHVHGAGLEGETEKMCVECNHLWKELQAEAKVSEHGQTTLVERRQELDVVRVELQGLAIGA